jgi:hypothetical protein
VPKPPFLDGLTARAASRFSDCKRERITHLVWTQLYYFKSDRINRIVRIFFVFINSRKKLMKRKSTFGGTNNLRVIKIPAFNFLPKNCGHHSVIISYFAKGN